MCFVMEQQHVFASDFQFKHEGSFFYRQISIAYNANIWTIWLRLQCLTHNFAISSNYHHLTGEVTTIHKTSFAENMTVTKSLALTTNHGDAPLQVRRSWPKATEPWVRSGILIKIKIRVQKIVSWYVFEWSFFCKFDFCCWNTLLCSRVCRYQTEFLHHPLCTLL